MGQEFRSTLYLGENTGDLAFPEVKNSSRVAEFWEFIAQNSEVMVESERAPGYKATLGVLIGMCAAEVTEENAELFFAEAQAMLAKASTSHEDEPETAEEDKEAQVEEEASEPEQTQGTEGRADVGSEIKAASGVETIKADQSGAQESVNSQIIVGLVSSSISEVTTIASDIEVDVGSSSVSSEPTPLVKKDLPIEVTQRASKVVNEAFKIPSGDSNTLKRGVEAKTSKPTIAKVVESRTAVHIEAKSTKDRSRQVEGPTLSVGLHMLKKQNPANNNKSQAESGFEDPLTKPKQGLPYEQVTELSKVYPFNYLGQMTEEVPTDHFEEISVEESPDLVIGEEKQFNFAIENEENLTIPEINIPVEEIEQTILLLAEHVEETGDDEAETVHQLLDEIVQVLENTQALQEQASASQEVTFEIVEPEEELKELFTQLFNYVKIDYSFELLESLVELVLDDGMVESILAIKKEEAKNPMLRDRGTHEVIKQLLAGIRKLKESIMHAYNLGKSALLLYSLEPTTT